MCSGNGSQVLRLKINTLPTEPFPHLLIYFYVEYGSVYFPQWLHLSCPSISWLDFSHLQFQPSYKVQGKLLCLLHKSVANYWAKQNHTNVTSNWFNYYSYTSINLWISQRQQQQIFSSRSLCQALSKTLLKVKEPRSHCNNPSELSVVSILHFNLIYDALYKLNIQNL